MSFMSFGSNHVYEGEHLEYMECDDHPLDEIIKTGYSKHSVNIIDWKKFWLSL